MVLAPAARSTSTTVVRNVVQLNVLRNESRCDRFVITGAWRVDDKSMAVDNLRYVLA
jgi:hypothetical protein